MSGRLIITTKKTYCPWSQQNVERVLRDERLERERIEREAKAEKDAAIARRRGQLDDENGVDEPQGHINLFPEAEEAELKLSRGIDTKVENHTRGILPVLLGGDEASNRKSGHLPFYLQSHETASNAQYADRVLGRKVEGDIITSQIMKDQAVNREQSRKQRMDPMQNFYKSGECRDVATVDGADHSRSKSHTVAGANRTSLSHESTDKEHPHHRRKEKRKIHTRNESGDSDLSTDSTSTYHRSSKRRHHKRKKKSRQKDGKHVSRSRHQSSTSLHATTANDTVQHDSETIQNLRRKRLEREAREHQRERSMLCEQHSHNSFVHDRDRGYHDQWNPMLSRK